MKFLYTDPELPQPGRASRCPPSGGRASSRSAAGASLLIVEDNPYGLLWFDTPPPPPLHTLNPDGVVYLGSFSKTFAPGFRVGWAVAPLAIREKLVLAAESAILSPSSFTHYLISEYFETVDWRSQIARFRDVYRERRDAMLDALTTYLPNLELERPRRRLLHLGDAAGGAALEADAAARGARAGRLHARHRLLRGRAGGGQMRLSFCYPTPEEIGSASSASRPWSSGELELVRAFAGTGSLTPRTPERSVTSPPPDLR